MVGEVARGSSLLEIRRVVVLLRHLGERCSGTGLIDPHASADVVARERAREDVLGGQRWHKDVDEFDAVHAVHVGLFEDSESCGRDRTRDVSLRNAVQRVLSDIDVSAESREDLRSEERR